MSASLGLLSRSDGSAKFSFGDSTVICSVVGPTLVKTRDEKLDKVSIEVSYTGISGGFSGPADRHIEHTLSQLAESLVLVKSIPRSLLKITLQVLSDDGSLLSTCINAMILALMDAGVQLKMMCTSLTCIISSDGELLMDPLNVEVDVGQEYGTVASQLKRAQSVHTFAFDSVNMDPVLVHSTGLYSRDEFKQCYNFAKAGCISVLEFMKAAVERRIRKEYGI